MENIDLNQVAENIVLDLICNKETTDEQRINANINIGISTVTNYLGKYLNISVRDLLKIPQGTIHK